MARKKKSGSKQPSDDKKSPEVEQDDFEPQARETGDGGWMEVQNTKKQKAQQRKQRKREQEESAAAAANGAAAAAASAAEEKKSSSRKAAAAAEDDDWSKVTAKKKSHQQPKAKKVTKAAKQAVKPANEQAVVDLLKSILENVPTQFLQLSTVGDRFQALTNTSWNKTYKPQYGLLKTFLESKPQVFVVDEKSDRVYLADQFKAAQDQKAAEAQRAEDQRQRKQAKKARQAAAQEASDSSDAGQRSGTSSFMSAAVVVALLAAAAGFTMYLVNSGASR